MTDTTERVPSSTPDTETDDLAPENAGSDHSAIRELVLRAHRDVVPELVEGDTVDALLASIEPARAAYHRLAASLGQPATPPAVPAGGQRPMPVDPDRLSASEKIRRGLAR